MKFKLYIILFSIFSFTALANTKEGPKFNLKRVITSGVGPFHAMLMDDFVYVAELANCVVKKFDNLDKYQWIGVLENGEITNSWSSSEIKNKGCAPGFLHPHYLNHQKGRLNIALFGDGKIIEVDSKGGMKTKFNWGIPRSITSFSYLNDNDLIFVDYDQNQVVYKSPGGFSKIGYTGPGTLDKWSTVLGATPSENQLGFKTPHDIATRENFFYVADEGNHRVKRYDYEGKFAGWIGKSANGELKEFWTGTGPAVATTESKGFSSPIALAFDHKNRLYILEYGHSRVQVYDEKGKWLFEDDLSKRLKSAYGMSISGKNLVISNTGKGEILIYQLRK